MKSEVKKIAVIYGCDSSEWEISCRSGEFVASQIDHEKYEVYEIFARFGDWSLVRYWVGRNIVGTCEAGPRAAEDDDCPPQLAGFANDCRPQIDKTDFSVTLSGKKIKFDFAYIVQHGIPGENGLMEGYLEMLCVPHSTCSAFVSAITFDKFSCKCYMRDADFVKCADDVVIRKGDNIEGLAERVVARLGLPLFVKPTDGGSSFGITKVKRIEEFDKAVELAFAEGKTVIVENAISGRELTCAVYFNGQENVALPVVEIVTENDFFDYDAKYNAESKEICPAEIPEDVANMVKETSKKIYSRLDCSGCVRADYILAEDGLYFIEINTVPGMTSASLVPQMVRAAGLSMTDFLTTIIENSAK